MRLSEHQKQSCKLCADDALKHNHCSWCGMSFGSIDELIDHLDGPCGTEQEKALFS